MKSGGFSFPIACISVASRWGGSGSQIGIGMRRRGEVRIDLCATDEFGDHATENKIHVHDLHTTILHQLGIDHKRLTFRSQGRDF
ncbi:MAG: DUF1501 domain-containing protein [Akkermansiaceae bacterium]